MKMSVIYHCLSLKYWFNTLIFVTINNISSLSIWAHYSQMYVGLNGQFCPVHNFSYLFPMKWLILTWNGQFCLICNFSNLFPLKLLRMTQNGQSHLIHNFSNLSPPKQLRMANFAQFTTFPIFSH